MQAVCSSETSVDFQLTTQRYIPEDSTLNKILVAMAGEPQKLLELIHNRSDCCPGVENDLINSGFAPIRVYSLIQRNVSKM
jgi:hypothetical protein